MYTIAVCDDESDILDYYTSLIQRIAEKKSLEVQVESFSSAESLLFHLSNRPGTLDILYLDITMLEINGISAARHLRKLGYEAEIIFLTSYRKYVYDSFEVRPFRYLLKDTMNTKDFEDVFIKAIDSCTRHHVNTYLVQTPNFTIRLDIRKISFLEVFGKTITVHYQDKEYCFRGTFAQICSEFEQHGFIKISQCYCINFEYIQVADNDYITLTTGLTLPISRRYKKEVKLRLSHYILEH